MTLEAHSRVIDYDEAPFTHHEPERFVLTAVDQNFERQAGVEAELEPADILSPKNAGIFEKMSAGGKAVASSIYEGLKNVPGGKWLVGKIGIAYNEKRMFGQEKKAAELKSELDTLATKSTKLAESKRSIETIANRLESQNIPGSEAIRLKLREIDSQITSLQNKQDTVQSKIEAKNNKISIFANKRDAIADRLIGHYEKKLAPIEENLARLETSRDHLDLLISVTRAQHQEQKVRLTDIEGEKTKLESELRDLGMSVSQIKKFEAVQILENEISQGRTSIRLDEEDFAKRKITMDKKIAAADAKANPHRDNRDAFVRVKQGRPMEIDLTNRTREEDGATREEVSANPRRDNLNVIGSPENMSYDEDELDIETERRTVFTMSSAVANWNQYIQNNISDVETARGLQLDERSFLLATKSAPDTILGAESLKQVFLTYLRYKKVAVLGVTQTIDSFLASINRDN